MSTTELHRATPSMLRSGVVDAHQHFWQIGQHAQVWPGPDLPAIYRDFTPREIQDHCLPAGLRGTVLVQSQPNDLDTDWLLDLAATTPLVRGVVGWVDFRSREAPDRIAALARRPKMRGLRPMLQDLSRDDWILDSALDPAVEAMIGADLSFDALIRPRHLRILRQFAARWPSLPIVIDHGAKPLIASGVMEPWQADLAAVAELPNVCCKLSGLATEAARGQGPEALERFARPIIRVFGVERLMWGSDWPVVNLASDFQEWLALSIALIAPAGPTALDAVFRGNATRTYRLGGDPLQDRLGN
jgi:L-fuconolactonase